MKTMTYDPICGTSIDRACKEAVTLATKNRALVKFTFNGAKMAALPTDKPGALEKQWQEKMDKAHQDYLNSPKSKADAAKRAAEVIRIQDTITSAIKGLPSLLKLKPDQILNGKTRMDLIMGWLYQFAHDADDTCIDWDKASGVKGGKEWLVILFQSAGFKENDLVGQPPDSFNTKERMGRYIVGQAINCLRKGMPPHPITISFCEKYFKLEAE